MVDFWSFLLQTLSAALVGAVLLLVKRLFLDKLSPRWQYGVWGILALRVLLPAGWLGRSLFPPGRVALEAVKTAVERRLSSLLASPYHLTEVSAPIPLFPRGLPTPGSVTDLLFYLYAAGAALCLLWFLCSYLRLRRSLRRGISPAPGQLAQVEAVRARYGLRAPARVLVCPWVESTFVCGPLRPVLVLPEGETDDKVLLHELLHLTYGDIWTGVALCLLRCLHWCNPLLWYCWNRAQNDCEALCDQRVLERLEGEARRDYGRILLSMAGDRYARAPGTSSMANGGANIKRRIASIARFKRYPGGTALGSGCVAAALLLACLVGTAPARAVDLSGAGLPLALAQARLNRPTTPAGALDTYAKAVLTDNGIYLSMVTPAREQGALAAQLEAAGSYHLGLSAPLEAARFPASTCWVQGEAKQRSYQAVWRVFNFLEGEDGSFTGLLALDCRAWQPPDEGCVTALCQSVRVVHDGGGWTVEPLTGWTGVDLNGLSAAHPNPAMPALTYTAQAGGLRIEVDCQYLLGVDNEPVQPSPFHVFSGGTVLEYTPKPDAVFTKWYYSDGGRAYDRSTGHSISLSLQYLPMTRRQLERGDPGAVLEQNRPHQLTLPEEVGRGGAGGSDYSSGAEFQCAPPALAVTFRYGGETYTCIARPEGGAA